MSGPTLFKLGDTPITLAGGSFGIDNMTTIGVSVITNAASSGNLTFNSGTSIFFDTGVSQRMMIDTDGKVGIGTTAPAKKLDVRNQANSTGYADIGYFACSNNADHTDYSRLLIGQIAENIMQIEAADEENTKGKLCLQAYGGNVGIGTTTAGYPLEITGTKGTDIYGSRYFGSGGDSGGAAWIGDIKLKVNGNIFCNLLGIASDSRIKKDIVELDDDESLTKLRLLKPCKYKYIDEITRGSDEVYGFIAQEIKDVLPCAVNANEKEFIPNVYKGGTFSDGVITLPEPHGLSENGNIRLFITNKARQVSYPYTVVDTLRINIDTSGIAADDMPTNDPLYDEDGNQLAYNIFVYGTEVDDFNVLTQDAIWSVATAALQEVDRIQQSNNIKIQELSTQLDAEKVKVTNLETQVLDLTTRLIALENP